MNLLEQELDYPLGDRLPAVGGAIEVAPGVKWLRFALPFALDHINLWLLRDEAGWTVVDCCVAREEARAQWEEVIATQLDGLPVVRVIVTHLHPDHMGLAHWLCERFGAPLWMSATDFNAARLASQGKAGYGGERTAAFFASHGLTDPHSLDLVRERTGYYAGMVPDVPARYRRMMDGDVVRIGERDWTCIAGYGHAPEHISLWCEEAGVLIAGDMVLPRISTNISVTDVEPESDPLRLFLRSIDRFAALPADTLVLPSHGKPFRGLHTRIRQLHDHHRDRLAEVLQACAAAPQHAAQILPVMFRRPLDLHQTTFAMGEAVAHLHALWFTGQLRRTLDADGIYRFAAA